MISNNRGVCYGCRASVDENQEVCHICGQSLKARDSLASIQTLINHYYPPGEVTIVDEITVGEGTPYKATLSMSNSPYNTPGEVALFAMAKELQALKEEIKKLKGE